MLRVQRGEVVDALQQLVIPSVRWIRAPYAVHGIGDDLLRDERPCLRKSLATWPICSAARSSSATISPLTFLSRRRVCAGATRVGRSR
jgi:hypothetical protein